MLQNCSSLDPAVSSFNVAGVTNATNMMNGSGFGTTNYDALLDINTGWSSQVLQNGTPFHAGSAQYTESSVDSGTTDGTTANKLDDSTQNFLTTVSIGDIVHNTTDDTYAEVTNVDSNIVLSLDNDIMVSGETYVIQSSDAAKGRYVMLNTYSWTITDAGPV